MRCVEDAPQSLSADMGVDLRGRQIRVAEKLLNLSQVRVVVEQVRGKRVPKRVRMRRYR
jgi:hypothetical protein